MGMLWRVRPRDSWRDTKTTLTHGGECSNTCTERAEHRRCTDSLTARVEKASERK